MLKEYLNEKKVLINEYSLKYLNEISGNQTIKDGCIYSVLNGGKKIRPILLLMTLNLLDVELEKGLPTACAIEMIHSFSLVHDDLPALDNDNFRRGKLTTHKKFGEAEAILIGDALTFHAINTVVKHTKNVKVESIIEIIEKISEYSGANGMISGQMYDIESEEKKITLKELENIHENKTGKLLKLPIEAACIIANANESNTKALSNYAKLIGLTFQIKDDILDVEGEFEKLGKSIGKDELTEKSTYPSILGMEKSKKILIEKINEAKSIIINEFGNKGYLFIELADFMQLRDN